MDAPFNEYNHMDSLWVCATSFWSYRFTMKNCSPESTFTVISKRKFDLSRAAAPATLTEKRAMKKEERRRRRRRRKFDLIFSFYNVANIHF